MTRHKNNVDIFNPELIWKTPILIIWAGGVWSTTAYYCAQMWCTDITVVDYDEVEDHNIASQFYKEKDIGKSKVLSLQKNIKDFTWVKIKAITQYITKKEDLDWSKYGYIVIAVDNMDTRKLIVDCCEDNIIIESRMSGEIFSLYTFSSLWEKDFWLNFRYPQSEVTWEICTMKSISYNTGAIGSFIASKIVRLSKWEPTSFCTNVDLKTLEVTNFNL